jgi:hypothetical protein
MGSLAWSHDSCDELKFTASDGTETTSFCETNRAPAGHPAGFVEAFANLYSDIAGKIHGEVVEIIGCEDGLASMQFVDAVLCSKDTGAWESI